MNQVKLNVITKAIDDKKGEDIQVVETRGASPFYDYVVIATVSNYRMASAIADEIEEKLALINEEVHHVEGDNQDSQWVLVDCDEVIVHLFSPSERLRINLEDLLGVKRKVSKEA